MSSQLSAQNRSGRSPHQVSQASVFTVNSSSLPTRPGSPILINSRSERLLTAEDHALLWTGEESKPRQVVPIDTLPDGALLDIFDHHLYGVRQDGFLLEFKKEQRVEKAWKALVHVCHRWRSIVFQSPHRLDLRLFCTSRTPARDRLYIWPTLPLIITVNFRDPMMGSVDNAIAALERADRVCQINFINVESSNMEMVLAAMQQPFPELTNLHFWSNDETVPVPDSFLGGSAPRLEFLMLYSIPFSGLPKLLLSATQLVALHLSSIPHSGYFSPDAIATVLPTLTSLIQFRLQFTSSRSYPDRESRHPPPSTRPVLPVLTNFQFKGVSEYLEDLVSHIDAPQLESFHIIFFNDIVFDTPQLIQFIGRTPKLKALEKAAIDLDYTARVKFSSQASRDQDGLIVEVSCKGLDWRLSSLEQVCTSCLPPFSTLEDLYFSGSENPQADWKDNVDNELWVELLRPFSSVKNLYLARKFAPRVGPALQELVEGRATELLPTILPALQTIFVRGLESSGPVPEGIGQFIAARQVAGHPIAVSRWD